MMAPGSRRPGRGKGARGEVVVKRVTKDEATARRRLDEHAGHIDETVVDAFFLLVAAVSRQCINQISLRFAPNSLVEFSHRSACSPCSKASPCSRSAPARRTTRKKFY